MNDTPLISVIVAVYNGAKTLQRCIDSVAAQTWSQKELIIIDGGSSDGCISLLEANRGRIGYWISEPDLGIYDAWNKGLQRASGEWICFLGADDYFWQSDVLEHIGTALVGAPTEIKLVYGQVAVVTKQGEVLYHVGETWESAKIKMGNVMPIPHPGLMHRYSWFQKYGVFNTSYSIAGDYEMLLRGWPLEKAIYVPNLVVAGVSQGGISSTPQYAIRQLREVRCAQREHGIRFAGARLWGAFLRVYVRLLLEKVVGRSITYWMLDAGRMILGKAPYWTKI